VIIYVGLSGLNSTELLKERDQLQIQKLSGQLRSQLHTYVEELRKQSAVYPGVQAYRRETDAIPNAPNCLWQLFRNREQKTKCPRPKGGEGFVWKSVIYTSKWRTGDELKLLSRLAPCPPGSNFRSQALC
jgi:hypothetical protein